MFGKEVTTWVSLSVTKVAGCAVARIVILINIPPTLFTKGNRPLESLLKAWNQQSSPIIWEKKFFRVAIELLHQSLIINVVSFYLHPLFASPTLHLVEADKFDYVIEFSCGRWCVRNIAPHITPNPICVCDEICGNPGRCFWSFRQSK